MTDAAAGAPFTGHGTKGYRAYILGVLLLAYIFNFIDRVLITIVQEPVRQEFGLSDTQLGLLGGPAFAILYTLVGIPIAALAERKSRVRIIAVCIALWSAATAACGLAVNYLTLFASRITVSIGEAGLTPPAQSVIGDYFPPEKRATAISIYSLGVTIGSMMAAVGGGFIAQYLGWREAFIYLGLPGVALALLVGFTIKEPPRHATAGPSFFEAFGALAKKPTFWHVSLGAAAAAFTGYGVGQFTNSFFIRTHQLEILQASIITGTLIGVFGGFGTFLSGWLSDKIAKRHPNAQAWLPIVGFLICTPLFIVGYLTTNLPVAVALLGLGLMFQYFYLGPQYSITQGIVHPRMRATAIAVLLFIINLIGYGLGPPVLGIVSDLLANTRLEAAGLSVELCKAAAGTPHAAACAEGTGWGLRYSIVIGYLGFLWAAIHFLFVWKYMKRDWHR